MTHLVFTYGTLLTGCVNHRVIADGELLGEAITDATFTLVSLGGFPGVVEGGEVAIAGELYRVDDAILIGLDLLEGNGQFYTRELRRIVTTDGREVEAWIYLLPSRYLDHPVIESGSWREYQVERAAAWSSWAAWQDEDENGEPIELNENVCEGCDFREATSHVLGLNLCSQCASNFTCDDDDEIGEAV